MQFHWEYWFNLLAKKNKERLRVQARDKYRNLSEEKKIKKEDIERIDIAICLEKRSED